MTIPMADDRNRTPQPLVDNQPIVNENGTPTQYFIRWCQERQIAIEDGITPAQAQQLIDDWAAHREIIAGVGLTGGGTLDADVTVDLEDTAVAPGTYGDATHSARLTIDQQGRVTAASQVPIAGGGGGGGTPVIRSFTPATTYNSDHFDIPLPAGTIVGDLVQVWFENGYNGQSGVPTQPGWTTIDVQNNGYTNGCSAAKVMTAGDIAIGHVTLYAGGGYYGVVAAICYEAGTFTAIDGRTSYGSPGSGGVASTNIGGMAGILATDTVVGFISSRGSTAIAVSAGLTLLGAVAYAGNAIGGLYQFDPAALGVFGMAETATFTGGNNGTYWSFAAYK